ncbi:MAG: hypothetical protein L6W00_09090 [Lentisphaeria bacterium]|nr:MAG: hypothetical protein L6W00_09090 [Lentisphaeria bacterium]
MNFRKDLMLAGAGGPDALQTSSQGRSTARSATSDFCGTRSGRDGYLNFRKDLMLGELEGLTPSRPLRMGGGQNQSGKFRLLRDAVRAEMDIQTSARI